MRIRLRYPLFDYLNQHLYKECNDSNLEQFCKIKTSKAVVIEMDSDMIGLIYDWANEQLCLKGFDNNYELNTEGAILEEISDLFFIE